MHWNGFYLCHTCPSSFYNFLYMFVLIFYIRYHPFSSSPHPYLAPAIYTSFSYFFTVSLARTIIDQYTDTEDPHIEKEHTD